MITPPDAPEPTIPRPTEPVAPYFVTAREGKPVLYGEDMLPSCGIRVVHPSNDRAPSRNHGISIAYVPPQAHIHSHSHETEETYVILEGSGVFVFHDGEREVAKGDFIHMPPWCEHGMRNAGNDVLVVLIATSPPNP
jgi:mannose-6-phosphate isomerase-like protein (cupin superfamily)